MAMKKILFAIHLFIWHSRLRTYHESFRLGQDRSHGGRSGAVAPKFLLCPPNFLVSRNFFSKI